MALTTYVSGEILTAASLNDNFTFAAANPTAPATAIFNETQSAATAGGASVTGSFIKRTLNTTIINEITSATLTSSVISLPAGTYLVNASAPFYESNEIKIILRNTTDSADTILGQSQYATTNGTATLNGQFTIAGTKNFEVQYRCSSARATIGIGVNAATFGVSNVYTTIQIQKVA